MIPSSLSSVASRLEGHDLQIVLQFDPADPGNPPQPVYRIRIDLPRIMTRALGGSTLILGFLQSGIGKTALILVFAVIQESLMDVFSSALLMACADPVIIALPRTNAAQRVSTLMWSSSLP